MLAGARVDAPAADSPTDALPHDGWQRAEIVFWLTPLAVFGLLPDYLVLGSQIMIAALFALSLDLLLGYAGIVSLGHAAFFGAGAYTAGVLAVHGWAEPITGMVAAGVLAAVLGLSVSLLVVRGQDLTRLMVTLGIGLILQELANRATGLTGGVDGLDGIKTSKLGGVFAFGMDGKTAYLYSFFVLFFVFVLLKRLVHSPFGLALRGLREGASRMPAIGVSVRRTQVAVFTVAAGIAGIAGALLAQTTQFVGIDVLGFSRSAELLIMVVLGGAGRLYGAVVGAVVYMIAQDVLSGLDHVYWQFWIGLLLVVLVLAARGGIMGGVAAARARVFKERR
jgi:branched-chain amino acid transport system permease protein